MMESNPRKAGCREQDVVERAPRRTTLEVPSCREASKSWNAVNGGGQANRGQAGRGRRGGDEVSTKDVG